MSLSELNFLELSMIELLEFNLSISIGLFNKILTNLTQNFQNDFQEKAVGLDDAVSLKSAQQEPAFSRASTVSS